MSRTKKSAPGKRKAADGAAPDKKSKKSKHAQQQQAAAPAQQKKAKASTGNGDASQRAAEAALAKLLGGMSMNAFLSEYFEKKPLHVRNDGSHQVGELVIAPRPGTMIAR